MKPFKNWPLLLLFPVWLFWANGHIPPTRHGISFYFKGQRYDLNAKMRLNNGGFGQRGGLARTYMDTVANCYYTNGNFVEILRQDHPKLPINGIALGFEFEADTDTFPYYPTKATIQFRDFTWGGIEFDAADTLNYTGLTNSVSDDVFFEISSFRNDTIEGRFSGLLLSGKGDMAPIDSGYFRVRLYRRN
jgi:hypothetical protein